MPDYKFQLVYAPRPFDDESLRGYFERLNTVNGMSNPQAICRKFDIAYLPQTLPFSPVYKKYISILSQITRANINMLLNSFNHHDNTVRLSYLDGISPKNCQHKDVRFCPKCLDDNLYMRKVWEIPLITECTEHSCNLESQCCYCGADVYWNMWILGQCDNCEKPFFDVQRAKPSEPLSLKISHMLNGFENETDIQHFIYACHRAFRPFDNMLPQTPFEKISLKQMRNTATKAFGFLHNSAFRHEYFYQLKHMKDNYKAISIDAVMEPWSVLTHDIPIDIFDDQCQHQFEKFQPIEHLDGIIESRLKTIAPLMADTAQHQITAKRLSQLLNLDTSGLQTIVEHGLIETCTQVRFSASSLIDLNKLAIQIDKLEIHYADITDEYFTYQTALHHLKYFTANAGILLDAIVNKDIKIYCRGAHKQLAHCHINKDEMFKHLHQHMLNGKHEDELSFPEIADILCTTSGMIRLLASEDFIYTNHWAKHPAVKADVLSRFLKDFISINRLAEFCEVDAKLLYHICVSNNLDIAFQGADDTDKLMLLKNNTKNQMFLRQWLNDVLDLTTESYIGH